MRQARLILEDGKTFCGWSFGFDANTVGEVVFNTAMSGYPESLTDPSYAGQILVTTYPLIGNYGVPSLTPTPSPKGEGSIYSQGGEAAKKLTTPLSPWRGVGGEALPVMESDRIHAKAIVVADYSETYSHWNAKESLASWLKREQVPGITGIDTRRLTKVLREHGVMMGRIIIDHSPLTIDHCHTDYGSVNWVEQVSCLIRRGIEVVRVPWDYDFNQLEFDGLFLANGPGDPERCERTVAHIRTFLNNPEVKPCMGICLGNQLLARAAGANTYKLKYGHRSHNQPVQQVGTTRCFITSQNHGYAVDDSTLPSDWEPLFVNMNDGSNEGIRHKTNPWMSAQFHPEACSGPVDTEFLFDEFVKMLG